ncbi:MAG: electron transport complex subunit RsxC [Ruminococcaceae bacterium]|nr:electron transport complex subunit RsxC [Oscillospiraceae bacterium]
MSRTFKGGVHPPYNKELTSASPIETPPVADILVFPLSQHIGKVCTPLVNIGDKVKVGQKIADSDAFVAAPIHSSVSGEVIAIEPRNCTNGSKVASIVIQNDHLDTKTDEIITVENKSHEELTPQEIIKVAKNAGIVGMGGATFPTYVKLQSALDKGIDTLIINGAECEPYITCDHRAMIEYPRPIAGGIKLIAQCIKPKNIFVAIEDNKEDAIATMRAVLTGTNIQVVELKSKFPQGGEKQLIKAITRIETPPGKLPVDVGCAVFNVDTCAALFRAANNNLPVIQRVVTVSGTCINSPKNLLVRIGTPVSELFEYCGGFKEEPKKIVVGGPMMGLAQHSMDIPVVKGFSAVLAFSKNDDDYVKNPTCIRCGRCVSACPVRLMPNYINMFVQKDELDKCEQYNALDCIECGSCSFICPARLYLTQNIRLAKLKINEKNQLEKIMKAKEAGKIE